MLSIGVSSGAFYPHLATENAPLRAAQLGFDSIELMLQTTGEYAAGFLDDVHQRATDHGLTVSGYHLFHALHPLFSDYQRRTDEAIDLVRRTAERASKHGVPTLVWHGATKAEGSAPDGWTRFVAMTERLAGICASAGITLAIENVSWCILSQVRDVIKLNEALKTMPHARSVGFTFDSFQALESGANPFMMLAAMDGRLANVHLSDASAHGLRHLLPGQGEIPWSALIKAIATTGFAGPMNIEAALRSAEDVDQVRALLLPIIDRSVTNDDPCSEALPAGVAEGIALFNRGEYYACHEVIEHEWHAERRPIRRLYQGILQIGVGLHHARGGNYSGAILLLTDGIAKVSEFLPVCQGVSTGNLVADARRCLEAINVLGPDRLDAFEWSLAPVIERL